MALTVTLANLRSRVLRRADHENDNYVSTAEVNDYINQSIRGLYDMLVQTNEDYFLNPTPYSISITSGTNTYDLPADFYKIRGVDIQGSSISGSIWVPIDRFNWNERNKYNWAPVAWNMLGISQVKYHIIGTKIALIPNPPGQVGQMRVWYVSSFPALTSDSDTFDTINGWDEWVTYDAAIKIKVKEESDTTALQEERALLEKRIKTGAMNRDLGTPKKMTDVNDDGQWWQTFSGSRY